MQRQAVINPGSSSWWLLSLSPLLYYDTIRISKGDYDSIQTQQSMSTYHLQTAQVMELLVKETGHDILVVDAKLPPRGRTAPIERRAKEISTYLLTEAANYRQGNASLVRPNEVKRMLCHAYKVWIAFNQRKASVLPDQDPLRHELLEKHLPRWSQLLAALREIPAAAFPEYLDKHEDLAQVFRDVIRNACLMTSVSSHAKERVYDSLTAEFLPAIELVERYRAFVEIPGNRAANEEPLRADALHRLYDFRLRAAAVSLHRPTPTVYQIISTAIRERKRFSELRKHLAVIDQHLSTDPEKIDFSTVKEVSSVMKSLKRELEILDKVLTPALWLARGYFLIELLSGLDMNPSKMAKLLISNPYTTNMVKNFILDAHISRRGLSRSGTTAISLAMDTGSYSRLQAGRLPALVSGGAFEFWA